MVTLGRLGARKRVKQEKEKAGELGFRNRRREGKKVCVL